MSKIAEANSAALAPFAGSFKKRRAMNFTFSTILQNRPNRVARDRFLRAPHLGDDEVECVTLAYQPKGTIGLDRLNADILVSLRVDADLPSSTSVARPRDAFRRVKRILTKNRLGLRQRRKTQACLSAG
ncbi:MAG: hypothetical protein WA624_19380 [Methylocella sp.]